MLYTTRTLRYSLVGLASLAIILYMLLQGRFVAAQDANPDGVVQLTGTVTVTNRFVLEDRAEPMMALVDLTAFIKRDPDLKAPYPDQTIASLQGDLASGAKFAMQLPIEPHAQLNDVSNGKGTSAGVAAFALDFDTNIVGDAFLGPFELKGGPSGLDALKLAAGTNEIVGGRMVVWAPDDAEMFPTGFGTDAKLFTAHACARRISRRKRSLESIVYGGVRRIGEGFARPLRLYSIQKD